jgi:hypothetical protein
MSGRSADTEAERRRRGRRFEDRMAVAAVLATLLGAIVAYVQSEAVKTSVAWGVRAQGFGVEAVQARATESDAAELQYSRFLLLDAERRRLGNSWQAVLLGDRTAMLGVLRLEAVVAQTISDTNRIAAGQSSALGHADVNGATDSLLGRRLCPITPPDAPAPPGCASTAYGPDQDLAFPRAYFAQASWNAERLTALRDAALARSADREGQSVAYTITLSMFGVAIFLFGFTLTPQGRQRAKLFSAAASGMVAFALLYGAYEALHTEGHAHDEAAAVHYADGIVALDQASYAMAARDFSDTIGLRPDFARPYYERALALQLRDAPPVSRDNPFGVVGLATLRQAIGDLRAARAKGLSLVDASNALAGDLAELGIRTRAPALLGESAGLAQRTARTDLGDPTPDLARGLDLLALGRLSAAGTAYRVAVGVLRRLPASRRERPVAGALTGLELLAARGDRRIAGAVESLKELVVGLGSAGSRGARGAQLDGVSIQVNPGTVGLAVTPASGLRAGQRGVSAQWYYEAAGAAAWSVVPAISGPVTLAADASGRVGWSRSFLAVTTKGASSGCLQPGHYRMELYAGGRLAATAERQLGLPALSPAFDREMNVAVCLPAGWTRTDQVPGIPFGLEQFPATVAAWKSADGSAGLVMMRLNGQFRLGETAGHEPARRSAHVAVKAIHLWRGAFPATPVASPYWGPGSLSIGFARNHGIDRRFTYAAAGSSAGGVGGAAGGAVGVVRAEAGFNDNDLAVVVAAYAPGPSGLLSATILGSVTNALN